ncbi:MAG: YitT family protein [Streptococcaceae bacterium]|jgi:uncharacterized membrane-anchored protein YitT (DUF2179 family)|nr:YitT family protein [Streptococcaceae bacterium]
MEEKRHYPLDILMIILGTCLYGFGLVSLNIPNKLAEGGITGITLILRSLFHLNPAYTSLILNIPIILLGRKMLGKTAFYYTIIGTLFLSFWLWLWQLFPIHLNVQNDMLIAALLAGAFGGLGSALVYRVGGTTGGSDVFARIFEKHFGINMGKTLFAFDILILTASLVYIDVKHMMYTLIFSFVFAKVVDSVTSGGYTVRGMLIITDHSQLVADEIMQRLSRGATFLHGEGAYSNVDKKIVYVVLSPREIMTVKRMILEEIDSKAFISVINVHEAIGEGFTFMRPKSSFISFKK